MKRIILICIVCFLFKTMQCQPNQKIWIDFTGYKNFKYKNFEIIPLLGNVNNPVVTTIKVICEKKIFKVNKKALFFLSASIANNEISYTDGVTGNQTGYIFRYYGGGLNVQYDVLKKENHTLSLSNTSNWCYTKNDKDPAKVEHKNFYENNLGLEWSARITKKNKIALRITYNYQLDLKYPEPIYDVLLHNKFSTNLGFLF